MIKAYGIDENDVKSQAEIPATIRRNYLYYKGLLHPAKRFLSYPANYRSKWVKWGFLFFSRRPAAPVTLGQNRGIADWTAGRGCSGPGRRKLTAYLPIQISVNKVYEARKMQISSASRSGDPGLQVTQGTIRPHPNPGGNRLIQPQIN